MSTKQIVRPEPRDLVLPGKGTIHNRAAKLVREGEREVVRLDARPGIGLAWWHDVAFGAGTIAFEVRGKNELQRSFVGVAFHGDLAGAELTYEAVYFRPFNFLAQDPLRRRHMVQYVCHPEFTWDRLREERPDELEATVDRIPNPDDWFSARVVVSEKTVSVYVEGSDRASLVVTRLRARRSGWVGYWVGTGSDGEFAGLTLTAGS
jgi:hypothetical protein